MPDDVKTGQETGTAAWAKIWGAGITPTYAVNHRMFECWARGMARFSHDMAQFMQSRLLEESMRWEKLASCRDPADAFDCESRFVVKASTDYSEAAQRFLRLWYEIANSYGTLTRTEPKDGYVAGGRSVTPTRRGR